jgi:hypothetical protein
MDALVHYQWPGNIRELQNMIERGVIVSRGPVLKVPIAEFKAHAARAAIAKAVKPVSTLRDTLGEAERNQILKALEQSEWVIAGPKGAAARLGMKRSTLQFRMRKLGIQIAHWGVATPGRSRQVNDLLNAGVACEHTGRLPFCARSSDQQGTLWKFDTAKIGWSCKVVDLAVA